MQQSLREDTPEVRERPPAAVPAARPEKITAALLARVLLFATGVGLFLAFVGAFGLERLPLLKRSLVVLPYSWAGAVLGLVCFRLVGRLAFAAGRPWLTALLSGVAMTPPMALFVWVASWAISPPGIPLASLPEMLGVTLVICVAMCLFGGMMRRRVVVVEPAGAPPAKFLERMPLKLRGGELWAVEAEDHYLRLHTSKGQDLILMRLADAIDELTGVEGAQVHRSWWVARDAIADARRGDGRATLVLKDGSEAPVSRTYARQLRERNWI